MKTSKHRVLCNVCRPASAGERSVETPFWSQTRLCLGWDQHLWHSCYALLWHLGLHVFKPLLFVEAWEVDLWSSSVAHQSTSYWDLLQYFDLCDFSGSNLATCFNDKARFRGAHQPRSYFAVLWLQGSLYLCRCASFLGLGAGDHGLPPGKTALSRGPEPNIAEGVERALRGF